MANPTAFLRYSNRTVRKRSAGRYDYTDLWQVPNIISVNSPDGDGTGPVNRPGTNTWIHEALNANNLPQIGDISQDGGMVCAQIAPESLDDQGTANIRVTWIEDPLTLPTEVHYFSQGKLKDAWRGMYSDCSTGAPAIPPTLSRNNEDIRNAAGDRFSPGVKYEAPLERIEIACHVSLSYHDSIDWSQYVKHWNSVNFVVTQKDPDNPANDSTRTFPKGTVFFADKRGQLTKDPYMHRLLTCTFLYDPDTWGIRVPERGPRARFGAKPAGWAGIWWPSAGIYPVIDFMGHPYGGVAELDATGAMLLPTLPVADGAAVTMPNPVVNAWYPVDDSGALLSADFADLDLFTPERTIVI
jgi:hypothetical protein